MTKVPRRDVSETDRGGSIRAAAPGAEILKITTRSSHLSLEIRRSMARPRKKRASHHPRPRADASVPDPPRRRYLRG